MSSFSDSSIVYELGSEFRKRVVEDGRSFLWPNESIWSSNAPITLIEFLGDLLDNNSKISLDEVASAIAGRSVEELKVASDAQLVPFLYMAINSKRAESVTKTFMTAVALPDHDEEILQRLLQSSNIRIPASTAVYPGLSASRLLTTVSTIVALRSIAHQTPDTATIESAITTELDLPRNRHAWDHFGWLAAHVLYPEQIAAVPGREARELILKAYGEAAKADPDRSPFQQLQTIRTYLSDQSGAEVFDFYDSEIRKIWQPSHKPATSTLIPTPSHVVSEKTPVYEVVREFQERVIDEGRSLLWPDELVWSQELVELFLTDFRSNSKSSGTSWIQIFEHQTRSSDPDTIRILADSLALLMQFPSVARITHQFKSSTLNQILSWVPEHVPDPDTLAQVHSAFGLGIGSAGQYFTTTIPHQIAYVPAFVFRLRETGMHRLLEAADLALEDTKTRYEFDKSSAPARHICLHLFAPHQFERMATDAHKRKAIQGFGSMVPESAIPTNTDIDTRILQLRSWLEQNRYKPGFDFYDDDVEADWLPDEKLNEDTEDVSEPLPILDESASIAPTLSDLANETFLNVQDLEQIVALLRDKKQIIIEGPPGSGKTFVAEKIARFLTGNAFSASDRSRQVELIQFHQSYGYEDFVEGIRPVLNDGQVIYETQPGVFLNMVKLAANDPGNLYVLIIDEINRGNISRIFGELMLLLEYRNESATLPYSKDRLQIPENLLLIGTMNSADRSLSQIDYALRRRFYFVPFNSVEDGRAPVLYSWLRQQNLDEKDLELVHSLFVHTNAKLNVLMGTDDLQIGHSYFMRPDMNQLSVQEQVWKYSIGPLIREYLFHHRDRDALLAQFNLSALLAEITAMQPSDPLVQQTELDE